MRAAEYHYGSWNKALIASGITPIRHVQRNKKLGESARTASWELGYVLGVLCGDGFMNSLYVIGLHTTNYEFAEPFRMIVGKWSGIPTFLREEDRQIKRPQFKKKMFHYYTTGIQAKEAYVFLKKLGIFGTYSWQVPDVCYQYRKVAQGFLSGWFDSEGNVNIFQNHHRVRGFSVNHQGLVQIKKLLASFGIKSGISLHSKHNTVICPTAKPLYCISFGSLKSLELFRIFVNFQIKSKGEKFEAMCGCKRMVRT
jgi:hypothetical protein